MDRRDESGLTALQYACEGQSPMSIVSLVQAGIVRLAHGAPHRRAHAAVLTGGALRARVGCDVKTPAMGRLPIDFAGSHQLKHVRACPSTLSQSQHAGLRSCVTWSELFFLGRLF